MEHRSYRGYGGSMVLNESTMEHLGAANTVIWLDTDMAELEQQIEKGSIPKKLDIEIRKQPYGLVVCGKQAASPFALSC